MTKISIAIDEEALVAAAKVLGTKTKKNTVNLTFLSSPTWLRAW